MRMDTLKFLLDKYNCNGSPSPVEIKGMVREDLPNLFRELGFTRGAEIGVWKGRFSNSLCKANPDLHLICVDIWNPYRGYKDHVVEEHIEAAYKQARETLDKYGCEFIRKFSMDALIDVTDESLDFVYIDANHDFINVLNDLRGWSRKVRKGGIISGHDYAVVNPSNRRATNEVIEAVNDYVKEFNISPWFLLGRIKYLRRERRDKSRSYMWVKS